MNFILTEQKKFATSFLLLDIQKVFNELMVILAYKLLVIHSVASHLRKYYFNDDRVELFLKSHKNFEDSNESDNIVHYYTRIFKGLVLLVPSLYSGWGFLTFR